MNLNARPLRLMFAAAVVLALNSIAPRAFAQAPVADKEYKTISPAVAPKGKKIEVIEFFSYACPHCAEFEHPLRAWLKNKPEDVEFKTVPLIFRESWAPMAKLHYTLEAMGLSEKLHGKVFSAIHSENKNLDDAESIFKWVGTQGVEVAKFTQIFNSFGMDAKLETSKKLGREHGVMFTPAMAINGKYLTAPSMAVGPDGRPSTQRLFQVVDTLIAQERPKTNAAVKKK